MSGNKLKYIPLFLGLFLASCVENETGPRQAVVEKEVKDRIEAYESSIMKTCMETAVARAEKLADSLLIERARLQKDTTGKPLIPEKPVRPDPLVLPDSTVIRPLFDSLEN